MRQKRNPQLEIFHTMPRTQIGQELEAMSRILDENPDVLDRVYLDLVGVRSTQTGRNGMTAEKTLRCAILKQYRELSYEELAFHVSDSHAFRAFSRLARDQHPSPSALQDNIKEAWEQIIRTLVRYAAETGVEKGRTIRVDSTATETHCIILKTRDCFRIALWSSPACLPQAKN